MLYGHIKRVVTRHGFGFLLDRTGLEWIFSLPDASGAASNALLPGAHVRFEPEWTASGPRATQLQVIVVERPSDSSEEAGEPDAAGREAAAALSPEK